MKWCADGWVVSLRSPLSERPQTACRLFLPGIGNPEVFISVFAEALSYSDSWGTCKTVDVFVKYLDTSIVTDCSDSCRLVSL